jgi:hypothetical protein
MGGMGACGDGTVDTVGVSSASLSLESDGLVGAPLG